MSEIQSITDRVETLSRSVDWWNTAMIWSLLFAAIAAFVVVATTRMAITRAKLLSNAQDKLIKAKDVQLSLDLKGKDVQIANANARSDEARARGDEAMSDAGKANERAKSLEVKAEELRQKNLEFEKAILPRTLEQASTGAKLRQFSNVEVLVVSPSEMEPRRTAGQIRFMLRDVAGWKKYTFEKKPVDHFFDGVVIHTSVGVGDARKTSEAAQALVEQLLANGIEARTSWPEDLGQNGMVVEVGFKPVPPALQPKVEDLPSVSGAQLGMPSIGTMKLWNNIREEE